MQGGQDWNYWESLNFLLTFSTYAPENTSVQQFESLRSVVIQLEYHRFQVEESRIELVENGTPSTYFKALHSDWHGRAGTIQNRADEAVGGP